MVNKAVHRRERHGLIREDPTPFAEGLICRDEHERVLVQIADVFKLNFP